MTKYKIKKLIDGYRVDDKLKDFKVIAIPEKKLDDDCLVTHKEDYMLIDRRKLPEKKIYFNDKFGGQPYALAYFIWKPTSQLMLL